MKTNINLSKAQRNLLNELAEKGFNISNPYQVLEPSKGKAQYTTYIQATKDSCRVLFATRFTQVIFGKRADAGYYWQSSTTSVKPIREALKERNNI